MRLGALLEVVGRQEVHKRFPQGLRGDGASIVSWNRGREDVAPSARRPRNCRLVAPTRDPLLSAARVDVNVLPRNGPRISPQTDWAPRYLDRYPIYTRHHGAERGRIDASPSRTL